MERVVGPPSYLLFQVAWVVCVIGRIRRAEGDEARQLRWFAYAVSLGAVAMVGRLRRCSRSPLLGVLAVPIVPWRPALAIVKYRLYDIDLVINKTLVVGAMAAIVTAGYVAVVVGVGGAGRGDRPAPARCSRSWPRPCSPSPSSPCAATSSGGSTGSSTATADAVRGARPAVEPARLEAARADDLFDQLASTVADGVGASEVTLWVGRDDDLVAVATWPPAPGHEPQPADAPRSLASLGDGVRTHVRPIVHHGVLRGRSRSPRRPARR